MSNFDNSDLLFEFINSFITFLSNRLYKYDDAIKLFNEYINVFESNKNNIRYEIELKMLILSIHCRDVFIKKYEDLAYKYFEDINSYFEKRFTSKDFNNFINKFIVFKIQFFKETGNYKDMLKESKKLLEIIKKNWGEKHGYALACKDYADALRLNGKVKQSLNWEEKRITIQEDLLDENEYSRLRFAYNNFAISLTDHDPKNFKKIKYYASKALNFSNPDSNDYWHALRNQGYFSTHIGKYEESIKFFNESLEILKRSDSDRKEEFILKTNLDIAINLSKIDLNSSITKIKKALKEINHANIKGYEDQKEQANKILKDNK